MCLCSVTDLRKSMPILDIVAGEAQERSWVSKTKLTLEPNWILSPLGMVRRWLSSKVACMQMTCTTQYKHTHTCVFKTACIHTIPSLHLSHMYIQCTVPSAIHTLPFPLTKHRVEWLYPLWVNVPIAYDPWGDLQGLLDHLAGTESEDSICPLSSVKVNVAQELWRRENSQEGKWEC